MLLFAASCGTGNTGVIDASQLTEDNRQSAGVTLGDFEVLRYNQDGFADPAMNRTFNLGLDSAEGETALTISVEDATFTNSVVVDVLYDEAAMHPVRAEFHGLLGGSDNVLSASFLDQMPGLASVAEAVIHDYDPGNLDGAFATVYFANGPAKNVSAAGDVHNNPNGVGATHTGVQNLFGESDTSAGTASVYWTAAWHTGDGDQNSETNAADLVPLGANFKAIPSTNWATVIADYDENNEVNAADLQRIGFYFQNRTQGYVWTASDNDGSGASAESLVLWTSLVSPDAPATAPNFRTAYKYWELNFDAGSTMTYDDLAAFDADKDSFVNINITPVQLDGTNITARGKVTSSVEVEVVSVPPAHDLIINAYDIKMTGVDNGSGGDVFGDGLAGNVMANSTVGFELNSISGTFDGINFTSASLAPEMAQADYDAAFNAARDLLTWQFATNADADSGFRWTNDWIDLDAGNPNPVPFQVTGNPGPGTVFPDDDPDSTDANGEGFLTTTLPSGGNGVYPWTGTLHVQVLAPQVHTNVVDVTVDEAAPLIEEMTPMELALIITTDLEVNVTWGSGGVPGDISQSKFQLIPYGTAGAPTGPAINLVYNSDVDNYKSGEFTFRNTDPVGILQAKVPGIQLSAGTNYAARVFDGTTWTSINKPANMLATAPPPPPQPLVTVPTIVNKDSVRNLQSFYEDPIVRRNGAFLIDIIGGTATPKDPEAYGDVLKINGYEFPITVVGAEVWPKIFVMGGPGENPDPDTIMEYNESDPRFKLGIIIQERTAGRFVFDIGALIAGIGPGDPDAFYAYKVFSPNNQAVGQGEFTIPVFPLPNDLVPIDWGINVWNREDKEIANRTFTDFSISSNTVPTATPDIIWAEFGGGYVYDWNEGLEGSTDQNFDNVHLVITDRDTATQMQGRLFLKIVGLDVTGNYLGFHVVTSADYFNPINPGNGNLRGGHFYDVALADTDTPKILINGQALSVIGNLP